MRKLKIFGGLFLTLISFSIYAQEKPKNDSQTEKILQMEQRTEDAVVRADVEYLKHIYAEDFRFAHGSGSIQNKSEWLASVAKRQFVSRKISANEVELHGDVAVTSARLDVTRRGKNGEEKYWLKYVRVYRRAGENWQMISHRTIQETHL
jgi:ketosteroid isomerase-like protein